MSTRRRRRPWTRAGTLALAAHLGYELAAGAGLPLAPRLGIRGAAAAYALGTLTVLREAGRRPGSADRYFALLNGLFLSAALGHVLTWPTTRKHGLPWLTECEGMSGRLMPPYNLIVYVSAVTAVAGMLENRREAVWGMAAPVVVTPWFVRTTPREFDRLLDQARRQPAWWNRRLRTRSHA